MNDAHPNYQLCHYISCIFCFFLAYSDIIQLKVQTRPRVYPLSSDIMIAVWAASNTSASWWRLAVFPGDIIWYFLIMLALVEKYSCLWCKLNKAGRHIWCWWRCHHYHRHDGNDGDDNDDDDKDDDDDDDDNDDDDAVLVGVGFEVVRDAHKDAHTATIDCSRGKRLQLQQFTALHCSVKQLETVLQLHYFESNCMILTALNRQKLFRWKDGGRNYFLKRTFVKIWNYIFVGISQSRNYLGFIWSENYSSPRQFWSENYSSVWRFW